MSRRFFVAFFLFVFLGVGACRGDVPNLPPGEDGGSAGTSGSSGTPGEKLAFVTKDQVDGKFGAGPEGALGAGDARCNAEAKAAGRTGSFKVFLCIGTSGLLRLGAGPWVQRAGSPVPARAEWGNVRVNLTRAANGDAQDGKAWTGCDDTGKPAENCSDFADANIGVGSAGEIGGVNNDWISTGPIPCSDSRHLYCFED